VDQDRKNIKRNKEHKGKGDTSRKQKEIYKERKGRRHQARSREIRGWKIKGNEIRKKKKGAT
jgi:hypothetical protein